jgi:hypothetical protein
VFQLLNLYCKIIILSVVKNYKLKKCSFNVLCVNTVILMIVKTSILSSDFYNFTIRFRWSDSTILVNRINLVLPHYFLPTYKPLMPYNSFY